VTTDRGRIELEVPRDRADSFDPQLISKYQRRFPRFDAKIISMYARYEQSADYRPSARLALYNRALEASLPGRKPSHSVDGVASLSQLNASFTLKARSAKLHHGAPDVDREDNHAPRSDLQRNSVLTPHLRLDNSIIYLAPSRSLSGEEGP